MIYLDNASTTQIDPRVLERMLPYLKEIYSNPNSPHQFGNLALKAIKHSRKQVSELIGSDSKEIIFTSGATEAINHAIKGIAQRQKGKGNHIVTIKTEHPAVLNSCHFLEDKGFEITYLSVNNKGLIDLENLKSVLRKDTILVAVMFVNNETGVIQPIKEISKLAHDIGAIFFSDGTQALGRIPLNVNELGVDIMAFSAHKIYGPKGIGALFLKQGGNSFELPAFIHGGDQENGLRSGTLNVPGIVGFGEACELAKKEMINDFKRIENLRNQLESMLLKFPGAFVNGSKKNRIFNITNICFPGIEAQVITGMMNQVAISNGSACSSATIKPSHVLTSMGLSEDNAFSSIRFSLGRFNTIEEIETFLNLFMNIIKFSN